MFDIMPMMGSCVVGLVKHGPMSLQIAEAWLFTVDGHSDHRKLDSESVEMGLPSSPNVRLYVLLGVKTNYHESIIRPSNIVRQAPCHTWDPS